MSFHQLLRLLLPVLLLSGCGKEKPVEEPVRPVRAAKVGDLAGMTERSFPGRAQAAQEVDLAFRVSGPLVALPVAVGDEVEAGTLVARIDPRDFEVSVRNAEGNLQRAQASENRAKTDYDRVLGLQKTNPGAISESDADRALESVQIAAADIIAFQASLDAARDALEYTRLTAPFDGTIVATFVENFENVREKQKIVRLLDKTRIEFEVGIPETMIAMAPYVGKLTVRFDAFPDVEIEARILEIGSEASSTTRTFPVTLIMDQPEGVSILPGMAGRAHGKPLPPDSEQKMNLIIPVTAVFADVDSGTSAVWVIDESTGKVSRRTVTLGQLSNVGYSVEEGLEPGEVIATAGVTFLKDGQVVAPEIE